MTSISTHSTTHQPTQHGLGEAGDNGAWRATKLSVAFIIVVLLTLLILPPLLQRRTADLRTRGSLLTVSARDVTDDIERDLAEEVSAARGFALTGDAAYRSMFEAAARENAVSIAQLRPLIARLGHRVPQRLAEFESALAAWESTPGNVLSGGLTRAQYVRVLPRQEKLFQQTIDAATNLDTEISRAATANRSEADRAEKLETGLTILLGVLALVAVLLLGRLARGLRNAAMLEASLHADIAKLFDSRARFLRGFTHDLKNPLGAADAYAQLLEEGITADPARFAHSVARIRASIRAALRLINDMLDLARAEAGELPVTLEELDMTKVAGQVADEYKAQAQAAQLELEVQIDPGLPAVVSDELRVKQVLGNLLSNAIKYTPQGGHVGIRAFVPENGGNGHSHWTGIQVWDTGPGIPQNMRDSIFDEFTRVDLAKPGVGLGLAISRRIADALGGQLSLENGSQHGAKFTLWLPVPNGT